MAAVTLAACRMSVLARVDAVLDCDEKSVVCENIAEMWADNDGKVEEDIRLLLLWGTGEHEEEEEEEVEEEEEE